MNLALELTSVTKFSKFLAFVLFIALPFLGFYLGIQYQKKITPQVIAPSTAPFAPSIEKQLSPSLTTTIERIKDTNTTKNWKTYPNTTHRYSVQYPPGWTIDMTDATQIENFQGPICCNVAYLTITNGKSVWELSINPLITGFDAPDECQSSPDICIFDSESMTVLGHPVERRITRISATNKIIAVDINTPGRQPGFGTVGIQTEYVSPDQPKYFIEYKGSDIEQNLELLDSITKSLISLQ